MMSIRFILLFILMYKAQVLAAACPWVSNIATPNDVDELKQCITDFNGQANGCSGDCTIDLSNGPFILDNSNYANNTSDGVNGLPSITNNTNTLTIKNGSIQRDTTATAFRLLHIASGAKLILDDVELKNGLAAAGGTGSNGGAIFNLGTLTLQNGTTISDNNALGPNGVSSGGGGDAKGGGIYSTGSLTINNSTISKNTATGGDGDAGTNFAGNGGDGNGGGIYNDATASSIENSTIDQNTATGGAGGASNNFAGNGGDGNGGGIYNKANNLSISNSTITKNIVTGGDAGDSLLGIGGAAGDSNGGGIYNDAPALSIENSTIDQNTATGGGGGEGGGTGGDGNGGGIYNDVPGLSIENSTIALNNSTGGAGGGNGPGVGGDGNGGGIYNDAPGLSIENSTIAQNTATGGGAGGSGGADGNGNGGGINDVSSSGTLTSTIVALNQATTLGPDINDPNTGITGSFNIIGDNSGNGFTVINAFNNLVGTNVTPLNPLLGPLQFNGGPTQTMALILGSPAINNGSNPDNLVTDQRGAGFPRESPPGEPDIGAYELRSCAISTFF